MKTLNEIGHTEPTEIEQIGQFIDKHQPRQLLVLAISEDGRSHMMERGFGFASDKEAIFKIDLDEGDVVSLVDCNRLGY